VVFITLIPFLRYIHSSLESIKVLRNDQFVKDVPVILGANSIGNKEIQMKYAMKTLPARAVKTALLLVMVSAFSGTALAEKINLNTADAQTMQYIPGIGLSRAEKIIEIRDEAGKFISMDEIDAVPGIGERTMLDVRKYGSLDSGVSELTEEMKLNPPVRSVSNTAEEGAVATSS